MSTNGGDWLKTSCVSAIGGTFWQRGFPGINRSTPERRCRLIHWPRLRLPQAAQARIGVALMNIAPQSSFVLSQRHLLGIEGLSAADITGLLDLAEEFVELNRQIEKKR